jgi:hypothetical protein
VQFLSDEWIDALDAAARAHPRLANDAGTPPLVVQQTVTDTAWGDVSYRLEVRDGEVGVRHGAVLDPTVSLTTDVATAAAIARGELAAQLAFMQGRLRIGGNVGALLTHQQVLVDFGDLFAEVRAHTDW